MVEFQLGIPVIALVPETFSQSILHMSFFSDITSIMKFLFTGKFGFETGLYLKLFFDFFSVTGYTKIPESAPVASIIFSRQISSFFVFVIEYRMSETVSIKLRIFFVSFIEFPVKIPVSLSVFFCLTQHLLSIQLFGLCPGFLQRTRLDLLLIIDLFP